MGLRIFDWLQILLYLGAPVALTPLLGAFMHRVFSRERTFLTPVLGPVERQIYKLGGVDAQREMRWTHYTLALLAFNLLGFLAVLGLQLFQKGLPLNPQGLDNVLFALAFNTAVSFMTNTNWQAYSGDKHPAARRGSRRKSRCVAGAGRESFQRSARNHPRTPHRGRRTPARRARHAGQKSFRHLPPDSRWRLVKSGRLFPEPQAGLGSPAYESNSMINLQENALSFTFPEIGQEVRAHFERQLQIILPELQRPEERAGLRWSPAGASSNSAPPSRTGCAPARTH